LPTSKIISKTKFCKRTSLRPVFVRIGGDEFALFTDFTEEKDVGEFAAKILSQNGKTVLCGIDSIPVSMRAGAMKLAQKTKYGELFTRLSDEVCRASQEIGKCGFVKS